MKLSAKARTIIKNLRSLCKAEGIKLEIRKNNKVQADGDLCGGYFDANNRSLVVASNNDEVFFLSLLFHEFGHFLQWRDYVHGRKTTRAKEWKDAIFSPNLLEARTYEERKAAYDAVIPLELGAERVMVSLLRKHKVGTRAERLDMTKTAALYLYCHRLMLEKKRWFKDSTPINKWLQDKALFDALPNTLRGVDFTRMPKKLRVLLLPLF